MPADRGAHVVVAHVDGQQAVRRHVARVARHQHAGQPEHVDQPAQQQRPRAAEGGHREVAHVQPALDGHLAQGVGLVPGRDLEDAGGGALEVEAEPLRQVAQPGAGRLDVERDLAAEQVRGDPAEHQVGVGHRRLGAAPAVAERARVGARRAGADLERALGRHPGDRAAAGADGDDVDHRDLARVAADGALGGERRLAVDRPPTRRWTCRRRRRSAPGRSPRRRRPAPRRGHRPPARTAPW